MLRLDDGETARAVSVRHVFGMTEILEQGRRHRFVGCAAGGRGCRLELVDEQRVQLEADVVTQLPRQSQRDIVDIAFDQLPSVHLLSFLLG